MTPTDRLPQLADRIFLTDGGLETTLIFLDGIELPQFAAFDLLRREDGRDRLLRYYERYIGIAAAARVGFILESPTWRASVDWGDKLGYSRDEVADANAASVRLMRELKETHASADVPMVVSGCVGPRGDGYDPGAAMTADEAAAYHGHQVDALAAAGAEMIEAVTMTNVDEAVGVARAAAARDVPVAISFTVETDGRLPTGHALGDAIERVDAATNTAPAYFMINCAHPTHFDDVLPPEAAWAQRIRGVRANASRRSHQELDEAPDLDAGDPVELGAQYRDLRRRHPQLTVLGGCCGTDHRHVEEIGRACLA